MKKTLIALSFLIGAPALATDSVLADCRLIKDASARVDCYDKFVDAQTATDSPVAPSAQSLFGTQDAEAKRIVQTTLDIEQITQIEAAVTDVRVSASKKLVVQLDNGQVWRQLDSQRLRLKDGDAVVISEASLGSFQMQKQSGSRNIRVKRVK